MAENEGATVLPTGGDVWAILAKAGKSEQVVDTGLLDERLLNLHKEAVRKLREPENG